MRHVLLAALLCAAAAPAVAGTHDILVGLDETSSFGSGGQSYHAPGPDALLVLNASDPAHPTFGAPIPMSNSVYGPPLNLQITPDGSLGLVASSITPVLQDSKWVAGSDNKVHIVDLKTMAKIADVTVGDQPQGVAIAHDGKLALVATRLGRSVDVLAIDGRTVEKIASVPVNDAAVGVAITPDGKRGFVIRNGSGRLGVLAIDGRTVTYEAALDIPTGANPYNIALTPDGTLGFVVNNGVRGNAASITVFDPRGPHPHVIDTLAVGDGPEGFAMAPDGKSAVVLLLHGSTSGPDEWPYHRNGGAALIAIRNGKARVLPGEAPLGSVPEGVAYSPDGRYVYAGDFTDKQLHILKVTPKGLVQTGVLVLPGHPASLRGLAF
jgi:DNA-binding beta-propeller fold protein YncE